VVYWGTVMGWWISLFARYSRDRKSNLNFHPRFIAAEPIVGR